MLALRIDVSMGPALTCVGSAASSSKLGVWGRELLWRRALLARAALSAGWPGLAVLGASQKMAVNFWSKYGACGRARHCVWPGGGGLQAEGTTGPHLDVEDITLSDFFSLLGLGEPQQLEVHPEGEGLPCLQPKGSRLHLVPL